MEKFNSLQDLEAKVDAEEAELLLCEALDLREVCEESRLKALARERIKERLASRGLVALPKVPEFQEYPVYVTRQGSQAHRLFRAFEQPSAEGVAVIRGSAGNTGQVVAHQDAAKQIAELIDEAKVELDKLIGDVAAV